MINQSAVKAGLVLRAKHKVTYPGMETSKLTDDQLMNKIAELHSKMIYAHNFSNSGEMVEQIQWMLETLQTEQSDRAAKKVWDATVKKQKAVIESDPELVIGKADEDGNNKKSSTAEKRPSLMKRTKTPDAGGTKDL